MDNQLFFIAENNQLQVKKKRTKIYSADLIIYLLIHLFFIKRVRNETKTEIEHRLAHKLLRINFNFSTVHGALKAKFNIK